MPDVGLDRTDSAVPRPVGAQKNALAKPATSMGSPSFRAGAVCLDVGDVIGADASKLVRPLR